jgi:hypothetical protein
MIRTVVVFSTISTCILLLSNGCASFGKDVTAQQVSTGSGVDAGKESGASTTDMLESSTGVLCDGSSTVTFAAAQVDAGQNPAFHSAWGFQYSWLVIVDGLCNFWIQGGSAGAAVKTGSLDAPARQLLATELSLGAWHSLSGEQEPGVADQGVLSLVDGSGDHISCPFVGCQNAEVREIVQFAAGLPDLLNDDGAIAVDAGILSIRTLTPGQGAQPLALPVELDAQVLADYTSARSGTGDYRLIDISASASLEWLRQQRDAFLHGPFGNPDFDRVVSTSDGETWAIAFRERVPFEDEEGRLPFFN